MAGARSLTVEDVPLLHDGSSDEGETQQTCVTHDEPPFLTRTSGEHNAQSTSMWEITKQLLVELGVKTATIYHLDRTIDRDELEQLDTKKAIALILSYKKQQMQKGKIPNKGTCDNDLRYSTMTHDIQLIHVKPIMHEKPFGSNTITWEDYNALLIEDVVDYRRMDGKFVLAQVMRKDGLILELYTQDRHEVELNFLDQYPYKRLFKAGSVTQRIPTAFKGESMSGMKVDVNAQFLSHEFGESVEGMVINVDALDEEVIKQVKVRVFGGNGRVCDDQGRRYEFWCHLDSDELKPLSDALLVAAAAVGAAGVGGWRLLDPEIALDVGELAAEIEIAGPDSQTDHEFFWECIYDCLCPRRCECCECKEMKELYEDCCDCKECCECDLKECCNCSCPDCGNCDCSCPDCGNCDCCDVCDLAGGLACLVM
eukprot:277593_1